MHFQLYEIVLNIEYFHYAKHLFQFLRYFIDFFNVLERYYNCDGHLFLIFRIT